MTNFTNPLKSLTLCMCFFTFFTANSQTTIPTAGILPDQGFSVALIANSTIGQSFMSATDENISSVSLKLDASNPGTGTVTLQIAPNPSSGVLSTPVIASTTISSSNLTGTITFDLSSTPFAITAGTDYRLQIGNTGSGIIVLDAARPSTIYPDGVFYNDVGGVFNNIDLNFALDITAPPVVVNAPIPTLSQWGLMIFGLLMLNIGVFVIRKKEGLSA